MISFDLPLRPWMMRCALSLGHPLGCKVGLELFRRIRPAHCPTAAGDGALQRFPGCRSSQQLGRPGRGTRALFLSLILRMGLFSVFRMSPFRRRRKHAVVALVCQIASLVFWQPTHFHFDFFSCTSQTSVAQHADADNCKHLSLSDHSQCAICASSHNRVSLESVSVGLDLLEIVGRAIVERQPHSVPCLPLDTFYRRGPPLLQG